MQPDPRSPVIYQLRIVLRGISPLIWRRLLVSSDTTLAHLHLMLQILFAWSNEHLHHFHIYGKDYGTNGSRHPARHAGELRLAAGRALLVRLQL